jgi:hypothetical protein
MSDHTELALEAQIPIASREVAEALRAALAELSRRSDRNKFQLTSNSTGSRTASITVPVALTLDGDRGLTIRAQARHGAFPTFSGTLDSIPNGPAASRVRLEGHYRVPLGRLGAIADAAGRQRVAEASLQKFFEVLIGITVDALRSDRDRIFGRHGTLGSSAFPPG